MRAIVPTMLDDVRSARLSDGQFDNGHHRSRCQYKVIISGDRPVTQTVVANAVFRVGERCGMIFGDRGNVLSTRTHGQVATLAAATGRRRVIVCADRPQATLTPIGANDQRGDQQESEDTPHVNDCKAPVAFLAR